MTLIIVGAVLGLALLGGVFQALGIVPEPEPAATSEPAPEEPAEPEQSAEPEQTASGLRAGDATTACDRAAQESVFPHKYKGHWIVGRIAARIEGDSWFVKANATVTSEAGAERKMVVECYVSGAPGAAVVDSIDLY